MPVHNKIGHSSATIDKQAGLESILSLHIRIVQAIMRRGTSWVPQTYHFIDTNAGTGRNEQEDCAGSPVVFLRTANRIGVPYWARFIEIDSSNSGLLCGELSDYDGNHEVIWGDNKNVLPTLIDGMPRNAYGMIYCDPNGVGPEYLDMLTTASAHPRCQKMDILIRCAGSAIKRTQHLTGQKMADYLSGINKTHWLVRQVSQGDRWQWTFLLGTNWDGFPQYKSQGFYRIESAEGQAEIERLNYTNRELAVLRQLPMPYASYDEYLRHPDYRKVRAQAVQRSGGV